MKIVMLSAEYSPFIKCGGLADAVQGLSKELSNDPALSIEVIIPNFNNAVQQSQKTTSSTHINLDSSTQATVLSTSINPRLKISFVNFENPSTLFNESSLYGNENDDIRFLLFSKICAKYVEESYHAESNLLIHCHDWHTSPALFYLKKSHLKFSSVLTMHNPVYQGIFNKQSVLKYENSQKFNSYFQDSLNDFDFNFLLGGIRLSNCVVTVSNNYKNEIIQNKTSYGENRLLPELLNKENLFFGIVNGIDCEYWNPETDPMINYNFQTTLPSTNDGKQLNKSNLLKILNLNLTNKPLFAAVTRWTDQKGVELLEHAINIASSLDFQIIILASPCDNHSNFILQSLCEKFNSLSHVRIIPKSDETLAHKIYAAADFLIIPSKFEPCGLTQLISMRYGTIPIVRNTGGLTETVTNNKTGLVFNNFEIKEFEETIVKAIKMFNSPLLSSIRNNCLQTTTNWEESSKKYLKVYQSAFQM